MTTAVIVVAVGLFAAVEVHSWFFPGGESRRPFGAVSQLAVFVKPSPTEPLKQVPQLVGPFDLWNGQWWRVLVSGFHHGSLFHLAMNGLAIWFMGRMLEPRMGRLVFLVFFLFATVVSLLPEFLLEHSVIGLSGSGYAMFGVLLVLRKRDQHVAAVFSDTIVQMGLFWLFACVALTVSDIMNIANMAHFCGFGYGWIAGQILYGGTASRRSLRWGFLAAHLAILPAFYYVMHPVWNGRYHWHLASRERGRDFHRQIDHLKNAVACDPSLRRPWSLLASYYAALGQTQLAWQTILQGLYYNRTDDEGVKLSRQLWMELVRAGQRQEALQALKDVFQDEAILWQDRLCVRPPPLDAVPLELAEGADAQPTADRMGHDPPNDFLPPIDGGELLQKRDLQAPQVDPKDPLSAAEGTST